MRHLTCPYIVPNTWLSSFIFACDSRSRKSNPITIRPDDVQVWAFRYLAILIQHSYVVVVVNTGNTEMEKHYDILSSSVTSCWLPSKFTSAVSICLCFRLCWLWTCSQTLEGHAFGMAKEKSFSILYSDGEKGEVSLDLIAPTNSIYRYWFRGIKTILEGIQDVRAKSSPDELFIKQSWEKAGEYHIHWVIVWALLHWNCYQMIVAVIILIILHAVSLKYPHLCYTGQFEQKHRSKYAIAITVPSYHFLCISNSSFISIFIHLIYCRSWSQRLSVI